MRDELGDRIKELLKTENEWKPQYNNRILPSFIMGKAKHNNRTGVNKFGSGVTTFKSFGRKKRVALNYSCDFKTEIDGRNLQKKLQELGIIVPLQTFPSARIVLSFADVNKILKKNN